MRNLLDYASLKLLCMRVGVNAIERKRDFVTLKFRQNAAVDPEQLARFVSAQRGAQFTPDGMLKFALKARPQMKSCAPCAQFWSNWQMRKQHQRFDPQAARPPDRGGRRISYHGVPKLGQFGMPAVTWKSGASAPRKTPKNQQRLQPPKSPALNPTIYNCPATESRSAND